MRHFPKDADLLITFQRDLCPCRQSPWRGISDWEDEVVVFSEAAPSVRAGKLFDKSVDTGQWMMDRNRRLSWFESIDAVMPAKRHLCTL